MAVFQPKPYFSRVTGLKLKIKTHHLQYDVQSLEKAAHHGYTMQWHGA